MSAVFERHLEEAAAIVASWPAWKRNVLGWWHANSGQRAVSLEKWRNSGRTTDPIAFAIVEMPSCPPVTGEPAWCDWVRHLDGREAVIVRGIIDRDLSGGEHWHDYLAHVAFGPESCHACVCNWASGRLVNGEYQPHRTTTDKEPRLKERGNPCKSCRLRLAKNAIDDAIRWAHDRLGVSIVAECAIDAKAVGRAASSADVTVR